MNPIQVAAILLCLAGFQGLFFFTSPLKKAGSWIFLQSGLILFLLGLVPAGVMLPKVLVLLVALVTFSVGALLCLFCRRSWKSSKDPNGHETAKRGAK